MRAWGYIAFIWFVALALSGSALAGLAIDWSWSWEPIAFMAVPLGLAVRGSRYSVAVSGDEVVIRTLVRTHRLRRDLVTDVRTRNYDGFWVGCGETFMFATVAVTTGEKSYTAYGLVGRRRGVVRAVNQLRELVALPEVQHGEPARHTDR